MLALRTYGGAFDLRYLDLTPRDHLRRVTLRVETQFALADKRFHRGRIRLRLTKFVGSACLPEPLDSAAECHLRVGDGVVRERQFVTLDDCDLGAHQSSHPSKRPSA